MMHDLCGPLRINNLCMLDGKCKNRYYCSFCSKTMQSQDSYPIYRRRDDKWQVFVRNAILDNRWVVSYNPYLLTRYNSHTNLEICYNIKTIKYIYKYIYKGHDKVAVHIAKRNYGSIVDEINESQDA